MFNCCIRRCCNNPSFNSCCSSYPSPLYFGVRGNTGITGTTGPIGPTGPTGPTGLTSSLSASFVNSATTATATGTQVTLATATNLAPADISLTSGTIVTLVSTGSYLINYNTTATSTATGTLGLTVYANGVAVPSSSSQTTLGTANNLVNLNKEFILSVTTDETTVALQNAGSVATTYNPLNLVITKLQ